MIYTDANVWVTFIVVASSGSCKVSFSSLAIATQSSACLPSCLQAGRLCCTGTCHDINFEVFSYEKAYTFIITVLKVVAVYMRLAFSPLASHRNEMAVFKFSFVDQVVSVVQ